jgi:SAM-dependent methyltransferase
VVAILGYDKERIAAAVRDMYSAVACFPERQYHFPTGREACRLVGYPDDWLDALPPTAVESFAGVGFPFRAEAVGPGQRVLDVGSGSGTDALAAGRLIGPAGRVYGLDMTPAMLAKFAANIAAAGAANVEPVEGDASAIPLETASVDAVTSNGVLNLVPDKAGAFAEIFRVLKPGGRAQIADIAVARPVSAKSAADPKLWAECVVGALVEDDYLELLRGAGFEDVRVLRRFDYFAASASADTRKVAAALGAHSVELAMRKPGG